MHAFLFVLSSGLFSVQYLETIECFIVKISSFVINSFTCFFANINRNVLKNKVLHQGKLKQNSLTFIFVYEVINVCMHIQLFHDIAFVLSHATYCTSLDENRPTYV